MVQDFNLLKYSHTTAYGISVCQRMIIRSHTQTNVRGRLGIRRVRSSYADIRRCTLLYAEAKSFFGHVQKFSAYASESIIRYSYAGYVMHTLNTQHIR